ncbi:MAG TPA: signal peptide peptidase SppA, partial [Desulfuromonadales bacterium]|nr:signal peptide peptidase SppA [Desulfuromonadales bacterium]
TINQQALCMKKRPFLMALLVLGAIFLFFLLLVFVLSRLSGVSGQFSRGEKVGVVEVHGVIASSRKTVDRIIALRDNPSIKAIVLRVDSPGGGVGPSQEIYEEIKKTVAVKPVVVSMGSVAASGGYYISAPANRIIANPGTITGSIGVIMEFTNLQDLFQKIGLKSEVVKSGKHKDIGSPMRPMTDEDRSILQGLLDDVHQQFIQSVADGRHLSFDKVKSLADGRIFSGRQAKALGLVDRLGDFQDAIKVAAKLGKIQGKPHVAYPPKEKVDFFKYFLNESISQLRKGVQERLPSGLKLLWTGID